MIRNYSVGSDNHHQQARLFQRIQSWSPLGVKIIALFVSLSFLFPYLGFAFTAAPYPVEVPGVYGYTPFEIQGKKLTFSQDLARVTSSYQAGSPVTVVCIEDFHCNYEVQSNIADLIHTLSEKHDLRLVAVEGASQDIDVSPLAAIPVEVVRERVGKYFLRRGLITGAEYAAAVNDQGLRLHGLESKPLYDQSASVLHRFFNAQTQGWCEDLRTVLNALKPKVYHQALLTLDEKKTAYQLGKESLQAYLRFLLQQVSQLKINYSPSTSLLAYAAEGKVLAKQPEDLDGVAEQTQVMEHALREAIYTTEDQRLLDHYQEQLNIIEAMTNITASPVQLNYFLKHRAEFKVAHFVAALENMARRVGVASLLYDDVLDLEERIEQAAFFYQLVNRRSEKFVDNLNALMKQKHQAVAVMITGGFHMPYVEALLKINRISFVTLKPRVTALDQVNPYFSLLQGKQSPIEKLLSKKETLFNLWTRFADPLFNKYLDLITRITSRAYRVFDHPNANQDEALQHFAEVKGLKGSLQLSSKPLLSSARGVVYAAQIDGENFVLVLRRDQKKPGHPSAAVVGESLENKVQFELLTPGQAGVRLEEGTFKVVDKNKWDGLLEGDAQSPWVSQWKQWNQIVRTQVEKFDLLQRREAIYGQVKDLRSWMLTILKRWQRAAVQLAQTYESKSGLAGVAKTIMVMAFLFPSVLWGSELWHEQLIAMLPEWPFWLMVLVPLGLFEAAQKGRRVKIPGVLSLHQGRKKIEAYIANREPFALAFTDLDKLSGINDFFGKALTDFLLDDLLELVHRAAHMSPVTDVLKTSGIREEVTVIRYGGDEGMLLIPGQLDGDSRKKILNFIRRQVMVNMHEKFKAFDLRNPDGSVLVLGNDQMKKLKETITKLAKNKKDNHFARLADDPIYGPRLLVKVGSNTKILEQLKNQINAGLGQGVNLKSVSYYKQLVALNKKSVEGSEPGLDDQAKSEVASAMNSAVDIQHLRKDYITTPTISIGAMIFNPQDQHKNLNAEHMATDLLKWADEYLEKAKDQGRNQVVLGVDIPEVEKEDHGNLLKPEIMEQLIAEQETFALHKDEQVPMSPVMESLENVNLAGKKFFSRLVLGLKTFWAIVSQKTEMSDTLDRPSVPKFDPHAPWQFSHAGLYAEVQEYLEKYRKPGPAGLPEVLILVGRAPPSRGPDKMEIVAISRTKTYLFIVEPDYRIEHLGDQLKGFKTINTIYGHGAADDLIALPHLLTKLDNRGKNDLLSILKELNDPHAETATVIETFRGQLERELNVSIQAEGLAMEPRITWMEMNTYEAQIGAMFAGVDKAAVLPERKTNKIVHYLPGKFTPKDQDNYRAFTTRKGLIGLLPIAPIQKAVSEEVKTKNIKKTTALNVVKINDFTGATLKSFLLAFMLAWPGSQWLYTQMTSKLDQSALYQQASPNGRLWLGVMAVILATTLFGMAFGIFLPGPATAGLMELAHHGAAGVLNHAPGFQEVTLAMVGMVGMTMGMRSDESWSRSKLALINQVKGYLRSKTIWSRLLSQTKTSEQLVGSFFKDWSQEEVKQFADYLGYKPESTMAAEAYLSVGLIAAEQEAKTNRSSPTSPQDITRLKDHFTTMVSQPEGLEVTIEGQSYQLKKIEFVNLKAKAHLDQSKQEVAKEIGSLAHLEPTTGTLRIYLFPDQKYTSSGLSWFSALVAPETTVPLEIMELQKEKNLQRLDESVQRQIISQLFSAVKKLDLDSLEKLPLKREEAKAQARRLIKQLEGFNLEIVRQELADFLTGPVAENYSVQEMIWSLLAELETQKLGMLVVSEVSARLLERDADLSVRDLDDLAYIERYLTKVNNGAENQNDFLTSFLKMMTPKIQAFIQGRYQKNVLPLVAVFNRLDRRGTFMEPIVNMVETDRTGNLYYKASLVTTLSASNNILSVSDVDKKMVTVAGNLYGQFADLKKVEKSAERRLAIAQYQERLLQAMVENAPAFYGMDNQRRKRWENFVYQQTDWRAHFLRLEELTLALNLAKQHDQFRQLRKTLKSSTYYRSSIKSVLEKYFSDQTSYNESINALENALHNESEAVTRRLALLGYCADFTGVQQPFSDSKLSTVLTFALQNPSLSYATNVINTAAKIISLPGIEDNFINAWVGRDIDDLTKQSKIKKTVKNLFYPSAEVNTVKAYLRGEHEGYDKNIALLILERQAALGREALLKDLIMDQQQPRDPSKKVDYFELRLMAMLEYLNLQPAWNQMDETERAKKSKEFNGLLQGLNGHHGKSMIERYIQHLINNNQQWVAQVYAGQEPLADLKAQIFATASWLDAINYSQHLDQPVISQQDVFSIARKIKQARAEPYSNTFNSAYQMGGQLLRKATNQAEILFYLLAHEHGHNILENRGVDRYWHFMTGLLHEWLADRFMRVFGERYKLSGENIESALSFEQAASVVGRLETLAKEVHEGARAQEVYFQQALTLLKERISGETTSIEIQNILGSKKKTAQKELAQRRTFMELIHSRLLKASLDILQQPSTWNGSLGETFMKIFATYLEIPFEKLPSMSFNERKEIKSNRILNAHEVSRMVGNLINNLLTQQPQPAVIFFTAFLNSFDQKPSSRLGRLKAWLGEPFLRAPVWETVIFTPIVLGLFFGVAVPTLAGLISINAVVFAMLHPGRSFGGKLGLSAVGTLLGAVMILPALLLGLTPFSAIVGFALSVMLHSAVNVLRLRPLLTAQGHHLKNPFERIWQLLLNLPGVVSHLVAPFKPIGPAIVGILIISVLASLMVLPGPAAAATATETLKQMAAQTPDMTAWLNNILFGTISFAALGTMKNVAGTATPPLQARANAEAKLRKLLKRSEKVIYTIIEIDSFPLIKDLYGEEIAQDYYKIVLKKINELTTQTKSQQKTVTVYAENSEHGYIGFAVNSNSVKKVQELLQDIQFQLHADIHHRYRLMTFAIPQKLSAQERKEWEKLLGGITIFEENAVIGIGESVNGKPLAQVMVDIKNYVQMKKIESYLKSNRFLEQNQTLADVQGQIGDIPGFNNNYIPVPRISFGIAGGFETKQLPDLKAAALEALREARRQSSHLVIKAKRASLNLLGMQKAAEKDVTTQWDKEMAMGIPRASILMNRYEALFQDWFLSTIEQVYNMNPAQRRQRIPKLVFLLQDNMETLKNMEPEQLATAFWYAKTIALQERHASGTKLEQETTAILEILNQLYGTQNSQAIQQQFFEDHPEIDAHVVLSAITTAVDYPSRKRNLVDNQNRLSTMLHDHDLNSVTIEGRIKEAFSILMNMANRTKWTRYKPWAENPPPLGDPKIYTEKAINAITDDVIGLRLVTGNWEEFQKTIQALEETFCSGDQCQVEKKFFHIDGQRDTHGKLISMKIQTDPLNPEQFADYYKYTLKIAPSIIDDRPYTVEITVLPDMIGEYSTRPAYTIMKQNVLDTIPWSVKIAFNEVDSDDEQSMRDFIKNQASLHSAHAINIKDVFKLIALAIKVKIEKTSDLDKGDVKSRDIRQITPHDLYGELNNLSQQVPTEIIDKIADLQAGKSLVKEYFKLFKDKRVIIMGTPQELTELTPLWDVETTVLFRHEQERSLPRTFEAVTFPQAFWKNKQEATFRRIKEILIDQMIQNGIVPSMNNNQLNGKTKKQDGFIASPQLLLGLSSLLLAVAGIITLAFGTAVTAPVLGAVLIGTGIVAVGLMIWDQAFKPGRKAPIDKVSLDPSLDKAADKKGVIKAILDYQHLNITLAADRSNLSWVTRLRLNWQTSRLGGSFIHWRRQLLLIYGAGTWQSKLHLFFGSQPLTPLVRTLAQSFWLQKNDLKQWEEWGQLDSFVSDWLDVLEAAKDVRSRQQGVQLLMLMLGDLKALRQNRYIKGVGFISMPRWLWANPSLSRRLHHLLANDEEKMHKRQQRLLRSLNTAA